MIFFSKMFQENKLVSSEKQYLISPVAYAYHEAGYEFSDTNTCIPEKNYCREIRIIGTGTIKYKDKVGNEHTLEVTNGDVLPIKTNFIFETGTSIDAALLIM